MVLKLLTDEDIINMHSTGKVDSAIKTAYKNTNNFSQDFFVSRSLPLYIQDLFNVSEQRFNEIIHDMSLKVRSKNGDNNFYIADSGCGTGKAMKRLSYNNPDIDKIILVSHDDNEELRGLAADTKFDVNIMKSEDYFAKNSNIGMIFDNYGAFFYSEDRLALISSYYNSLAIGGEAHVKYSSKKIGVKDKVLDGTSAIGLKEFLLRNYSDIFNEDVEGVLKISRIGEENKSFALNKIRSENNVDISLNPYRTGIGHSVFTYIK